MSNQIFYNLQQRAAEQKAQTQPDLIDYAKKLFKGLVDAKQIAGQVYDIVEAPTYHSTTNIK